MHCSSFFTFFYTLFKLNPEKTVENLQKSGAYIHGVRPGKGTKLTSKLLMRLAAVVHLPRILGLLPILAQNLWDFLLISLS